MQLQADLINLPVEVPEEKEMSAYGAAVLSAYAQGEFSALSDIKHCVDIKYRFEPAMSQDQRPAANPPKIQKGAFCRKISLNLAKSC